MGAPVGAPTTLVELVETTGPIRLRGRDRFRRLDRLDERGSGRRRRSPSWSRRQDRYGFVGEIGSGVSTGSTNGGRRSSSWSRRQDRYGFAGEIGSGVSTGSTNVGRGADDARRAGRDDRTATASWARSVPASRQARRTWVGAPTTLVELVETTAPIRLRGRDRFRRLDRLDERGPGRPRRSSSSSRRQHRYGFVGEIGSGVSTGSTNVGRGAHDARRARRARQHRYGFVGEIGSGVSTGSTNVASACP